MKRLFFVLVLFSHYISATEVKKVFHDCHSYVCFDGNFYIHDPECRCDVRWHSITRDYQNNIVNTTEHIKLPVSCYE